MLHNDAKRDIRECADSIIELLVRRAKGWDKHPWADNIPRHERNYYNRTTVRLDGYAARAMHLAQGLTV